MAEITLHESNSRHATPRLLGFAPMTSFAQKFISDWFSGLGRFGLLVMESLASLFTFKVRARDLVYQLYYIGVKSQTVVLVTGAFTGMVLAAQAYYQFHQVKMDTATLALVGVSMCSELGPVLTALMVAGRVGASIAAEIGTMRVTEQIDALRTLATHPVDYLVVPRLLAAIIVMPILTAEAVTVGIAGGYTVAVQLLGVDPTYSWHNMLRYTTIPDFSIGQIKSIVFGAIIAVIGCYKGMTCRDGAEGVGHATTEAVVYSSITILIANFFLTLLLGRLFHII